MYKSLCLSLVMLLGSACDVGCSGVIHSKPGEAVIDCLTADSNQITQLESELSPIVQGGKADWSAIYDRAKHAGKVIGGCVLSELVQSYLGGKKAPENGDSWEAHSTLERFRKDVADGATFHTKAGDL